MNAVLVLVVLGAVVVDACPVVVSTNGSCCEVKSSAFKFATASLKSRVYSITNFCGECDLVAEGFCDAESGGGGWLVVQRRQDGSVDFTKTWAEYEEGFGDLNGEFWYGLHPLHCLTSQGQWQLRIDFTFSNGTKSFLLYNSFVVGSASSQYKLSISGFNGVTTDPFYNSHPLNNMKFTTKDRDNDLSSANCAVNGRDGNNGGGWWYKDCSLIHPNYQYGRIRMRLNRIWDYFIPFIEIKIRPYSCAN